STGAAPFIFDLTESNALIYRSIPDTTNYIITYHNTLLDAENDTAAIGTANAYDGTDGEVMYARLDYLGSDCFDTASFTLNIIDEPIINPVLDMELCDDASNDGLEEFDLELQTPGILGSQPAANFEVTYYTSFADADAETNAITSPYQNISNPQPIYVRLESLG